MERKNREKSAKSWPSWPKILKTLKKINFTNKCVQNLHVSYANAKIDQNSISKAKKCLVDT